MKLRLLLSLLVCISTIQAERTVTPTIVNRSQGRSADLKVAGLSEKIHVVDDSNYVNVDATVGFGQSFRSNKLAQCLFGSDLVNCNQILIQGTDVEDRNATAWLADYFYLAPDYNAHFSIKPRIKNVLVNLDLYVGLDEWLDGLYFRAHGPIAWSQWNLNFYEPCDVITTNSFRPGYFAHNTVSNDQLLNTFGDYACGNAPESTSGFNNSSEIPLLGIGILFEKLKFAKMDRQARSRTGFADLRLELGYDFFKSEDYHLGINVQVAAPTGSRRSAEFVFDPTIGNGNHWEVGAGVTAHYLFWQSDAEDKYVGFYLDASITHINNGTEQRTFDLCGRPNSRYMLAQKMGNVVDFLKTGSSTTDNENTVATPTSQFKSVFAPVANLTTVDVHIRSSIQADLAVMFNYTTSNWGFDVGYNFWARSCEKINVPDRSTKGCCPNLCTMDKDSWALKGDAAVFGFMSGPSGGATLAQNDPIPLSATQCGATIHKGTNADADVTDCTGVDRLQNCGVDNQLFAYGQDPNPVGSAAPLLVHSPGLTAGSDGIKTSSPAKFINCCDINFQPTRGLSHKLFLNGNYTWEKDGWDPHLGIGGSVEFANHTSDNNCQETAPDCNTPCTDSCCASDCCSECLSCAPSQWMVWVKGGVTFN